MHVDVWIHSTTVCGMASSLSVCVCFFDVAIERFSDESAFTIV